MLDFLNNKGIVGAIMGDKYLYINQYTVGDWILWAGALIFVIVAAYLLGSVNTAIIISKCKYGEDIRTKGSGNAGMTNMLRTYGKPMAILTMAGDLLKTALGIAIAGLVFGFQYFRGVSVCNECYLAGLAVVLGHVFPIFYGGKGGKGVLATSLMACILSPLVFLIVGGLFFAIVGISRYVSLGSVSVVILYPVALNAYFLIVFGGLNMPPFAAIASIAVAILVVWCHRENLKRISQKTERKLWGDKKVESSAPEVNEDNE